MFTEYEDFVQYFSDKVELYGRDRLRAEASGDYSSAPEIRLMRKGESAVDERERKLIIGTNLKYHGDSSDVLKEDYLVVGQDSEMCRFPLYALFEAYKVKGWDFVAETIKNNYSILLKVQKNNYMDRLGDYEFMRDKLIIKMHRSSYVSVEDEGGIYKDLGDIRLVMYVVVFEDEGVPDGVLASSLLAKELLDIWNITEGQLWSDAMKSMRRRYPPAFVPDIMYPGCVDIDGLDAETFRKERGFGNSWTPFVTARYASDGAVAVFYPGVCEKMAELFQSGFYICFTEGQGALLGSDLVSPMGMKNMMMSLEGVISDKVYHYDNETKKLEVAVEKGRRRKKNEKE